MLMHTCWDIGTKADMGGCVRGLDTKRVILPIFEEKCDPGAYLDWEWQCEQNF